MAQQTVQTEIEGNLEQRSQQEKNSAGGWVHDMTALRLRASVERVCVLCPVAEFSHRYSRYVLLPRFPVVSTPNH
jgi:hypothetical protein